jgi:hypothetical protein
VVEGAARQAKYRSALGLLEAVLRGRPSAGLGHRARRAASSPWGRRGSTPPACSAGGVPGGASPGRAVRSACSRPPAESASRRFGAACGDHLGGASRPGRRPSFDPPTPGRELRDPASCLGFVGEGLGSSGNEACRQPLITPYQARGPGWRGAPGVGYRGNRVASRYTVGGARGRWRHTLGGPGRRGGRTAVTRRALDRHRPAPK